MAQDAVYHLRQAVSMMTGLGVASRDTIVIAYAVEQSIPHIARMRFETFGFIQLTFEDQELKLVHPAPSHKIPPCPY